MPTKPRQMALTLNRIELKPARKCASTQIRAARSLLCELLVRDDRSGEAVLVGTVREVLDRAVLRLDQLAGMQELYELWVG